MTNKEPFHGYQYRGGKECEAPECDNYAVGKYCVGHRMRLRLYGRLFEDIPLSSSNNLLREVAEQTRKELNVKKAPPKKKSPKKSPVAKKSPIVKTDKGERPRYAEVCLCDPAHCGPNGECQKCFKPIVLYMKNSLDIIRDWSWFLSQEVESVQGRERPVMGV